jgi:hypothetical protein
LFVRAANRDGSRSDPELDAAVAGFIRANSSLDKEAAALNYGGSSQEHTAGCARLELSARSREPAGAPEYERCRSAQNPSSGKDSDIWQGK